MIGPVCRCILTFVVLYMVLESMPQRLVAAEELPENVAKAAKRLGSTPSLRGGLNRRLASNDRWLQRWGGTTEGPWRNGAGRTRQRLGSNRDSSPDERRSLRSSAQRRGMGVAHRTQQSVSTGYVFIEGEYLRPPYTLRIEDQALLVNDHPVPLPPDDVVEEQPSTNLATSWLDRLSSELRLGAVVVAVASDSQGAASISILPRFDEGYELLKYISDPTTSNIASKQVPSCFAEFVGYEPSSALRHRRELDLAHLESAGVLRTEPVFTDASLGSWGYPLTAVAMFLVAVACGQLFVSRSLLFSDVKQDGADTFKATQRCLLFIVGLSLLDLACTLSAHQAGVMHELNPLAGQLLSSPMALTAFKIGVTVGGAALLYALRTHFSARRAAWWLCLVCVLVAARWVAFNSLFIT